MKSELKYTWNTEKVDFEIKAAERIIFGQQWNQYYSPKDF